MEKAEIVNLRRGESFSLRLMREGKPVLVHLSAGAVVTAVADSFSDDVLLRKLVETGSVRVQKVERISAATARTLTRAPAAEG
jgi:hypothetical protein